MSKLSIIQIETAFGRAVLGESVRGIAVSLKVTEGAIRYHFRKTTPVKEVRRVAWELACLEQARDRLNEAERLAVDIQVARLKTSHMKKKETSPKTSYLWGDCLQYKDDRQSDQHPEQSRFKLSTPPAG